MRISRLERHLFLGRDPMGVDLAIVAAVVALYAVVATRLGRWSITGPMVFVAVGFLLGPRALGLLTLSAQAELVKSLTEITLALLLFADASTLNLRQVREDEQLPLRLLTIGMLLTLVLGTLIAIVLLPGEGLAFAALIAAILAPTDAALGLPIFTNPLVPVRIRRALNVESGLNDGVATPFVALFLAFAISTEEHASDHWLLSALAAIALGAVIGGAIGAGGAWILTQARKYGWTSHEMERLAILAAGLTAYFVAVLLQGNGFIAAFVGGITFGYVSKSQFAESTEFTEALSALFSWLVWTIFGAILVSAALTFTSDWRPILYAALSLTLIRMLPVALALLGMGFRADTVAIIGWFGPRGLASVVFTLLAYTELTAAGKPIDTLVAVATWTIVLSVFAHGLSARPLSAWYARRLKAADATQVELAELSELRPRHRVFRR
jgi:NhaP-type Na+/H+ or K+/H+ antiporter